MNRRNIIRGLIAATFVPAVPAVQSAETTKREAMRLLRNLPDGDAFELHLLRIAMSDGSRQRDRALKLFDSGLPIAEVRVRLEGGAA
jgi:hypothetical protein